MKRLNDGGRPWGRPPYALSPPGGLAGDHLSEHATRGTLELVGNFRLPSRAISLKRNVDSFGYGVSDCPDQEGRP